MWKDPLLAKKVIKPEYLVHVIAGIFIILSLTGINDLTLIDWDEGVFALQAQWIASLGLQGKPFNFQTPPLYQIIIAIFFKFLQPNGHFLPLISICFSTLTLYLVFYLSRLLYPDEKGIIAVLFFVTSEYFLFFSRSGLSDATFLSFFTGTLLFFIKGVKTKKYKFFIISGLLTTFAFYTKYSAFPLLIILFIVGIRNQKTIRKYWYLPTIIIPSLLFLPYLYLYLRFIPPSIFNLRHGALLGINHHKFLLYLMLFSPMPFGLSIGFFIYSIANKKGLNNPLIILAFCIYFFFVGFYHPYFRLAYPLIPLLAIFAAHSTIHWGKYKYPVCTMLFVLSLIVNFDTMRYHNLQPQKIGQVVDSLSRQENIRYIYTLTPPNINFYIDHSTLIPENHTWFSIGEKFPYLIRNKKIIYKEINELYSENKILFVHSSIFDSVRIKYAHLYKKGVILYREEFKDAPVYYKDLFNPLRRKKQIYEIYLFDTKNLGEQIDKLWELGFEKQTTVLIRN